MRQGRPRGCLRSSPLVTLPISWSSIARISSACAQDTAITQEVSKGAACWGTLITSRHARCHHRHGGLPNGACRTMLTCS